MPPTGTRTSSSLMTGSGSLPKRSPPRAVAVATAAALAEPAAPAAELVVVVAAGRRHGPGRRPSRSCRLVSRPGVTALAVALRAVALLAVALRAVALRTVAPVVLRTVAAVVLRSVGCRCGSAASLALLCQPLLATGLALEEALAAAVDALRAVAVLTASPSRSRPVVIGARSWPTRRSGASAVRSSVAVLAALGRGAAGLRRWQPPSRPSLRRGRGGTAALPLLDGLDQLALAKSSDAADAELAGHGLQLGEHHRGETAAGGPSTGAGSRAVSRGGGVLLGRGGAAGGPAEGAGRWCRSRRVLPVGRSAARCGGAECAAGRCGSKPGPAGPRPNGEVLVACRPPAG